MRKFIIILFISTTLTAEMKNIPCNLDNPKCVPPETYKITNKHNFVAYNVLVRFGGEIPSSALNQKFWLWIKVEDSPLCNSAQRNLYQEMCDTKIGQIFYMTPPFRTCDPIKDRTCR